MTDSTALADLFAAECPRKIIGLLHTKGYYAHWRNQHTGEIGCYHCENTYYPIRPSGPCHYSFSPTQGRFEALKRHPLPVDLTEEEAGIVLDYGKHCDAVLGLSPFIACAEDRIEPIEMPYEEPLDHLDPDMGSAINDQ